MNTEQINGHPVPQLDEKNRLFPSYDVQMLVGLGSCGAVYYALKENQAVSIKVVVGPKNVRTECEFRSEADSMSAMDHPNIVKVFEHGEREGHRFIIMEYIARGTLHEVMQEFKFDEKSIASMAVQICDGLAHAHEKGYIHRDIKPDNIMIAEDWSPKIMDFGLAVNLADPQYGYTAVGSKGYAAPEVTKDPKNIDFRVDVYAMGALLFTMLTGDIPSTTNPNYDKLKGYDVRFKMLVKNAMQLDVEKRTESIEGISSKLLSMMKSWELHSL